MGIGRRCTTGTSVGRPTVLGSRSWISCAGADEQVAGEWWLAVDATVIRAHQHAAGARHASPKDVPVQRLAPTVLEASEHARPRARGWVELQEFPFRSG